MTAIITLCAGARSRGLGSQFGPTPQRAPLAGMLHAIEAQLRDRRLMPVAIVAAQSWRLGRPSSDEYGRAFWSELAVEAAPRVPANASTVGRQPFASWYQWQHVRFAWSIAPLPKDADRSPDGSAADIRDGRPGVAALARATDPRATDPE